MLVNLSKQAHGSVTNLFVRMVRRVDSEVDAFLDSDPTSSKLLNQLLDEVARLFYVVGGFCIETFLDNLDANEFGGAEFSCVHQSLFDRPIELNITDFVTQERSIYSHGFLGYVLALLGHD